MENAASFETVDSCFPELPPCSPPHSSPLPSFWTKHFDSSHKQTNSAGALPKKADVVIIGSGITGSCVAARIVEGLLERGGAGKVEIVVLEAREFCSGATGRNGGHLTPSPSYQFKSIAEMASVEDAKKEVHLEDRATNWVLETCEAEGWEEDVDLVRGGCLHLFEDAKSEAAVKEELESATAAGVDLSAYTWLSSAEALAQYGSKTYSALIVPGNNLYPLKFVSKVFSRALDSVSHESSPVSLTLYTNALVTSISPSSSSWTLETSRGPLTTTYLIHATNGYASSILPSLSTGPTRIVPTRGQVLSLAPSPSSNPRWTSAFSASEGFEYFFQRPNGGPVILGGGRAVVGPPYEFGETDDGRVNPKIGVALRGYLGKQFPRWFGEEEGTVEMEWTGIMGYRKGGVPLVGRVFVDGKALKGQYISAGYSGHGMSRAPACAEAIASMLLADLRGEEGEAPAWLPGHYLSKAS